jgi:hypothetical protein
MKRVMAAIDPGIRGEPRIDLFLRRWTRLAVVFAYLTAAVVGLMLLRPAFRTETSPAIIAAQPGPPATDALRKGESVATFAARHGLDLAEVLALNPKIDSLDLPRGTKLRIR